MAQIGEWEYQRPGSDLALSDTQQIVVGWNSLTTTKEKGIMSGRDDFEIRTMSREEIDFAVSLAAKEGWNPGLHDASSFYAADPDGFLIGLLAGEPIGCISAVSYEGRFGFLGLYIVIPERRGEGFGIRLWDAAMKRMANHNVGLDGVVEQQENYKKSGFRLAYRNIRYEFTNSLSGIEDSHLVRAAELPFSQIAEYDRRMFPAARDRFLKTWLTSPDSDSVAWMDGGILCGYATIRECQAGYKIGPLFADSEKIVEALLQALCQRVPSGVSVYLDVPEVNGPAVAMVQRHGMTPVFETARMYTQEPPPICVEKIFGVTTFELG